MLRISVLSPKGGVGKTAFAANLAASLSERVGSVLALDLDPQNTLRLHFGIDPSDEGGFARNVLKGVPWQEAMVRNRYGVDVLPFGELALLTDDTDVWYASGSHEWIDGIFSDPVVSGYASAIIDTPPGPTPILRKMMAVSDLVFIVLLPEAASFACIPAMKRRLQDQDSQPIRGHQPYYVLNQMDARRRLHRDVRAVMGQLLGDSLMDFYIHSDASVGEALAQQQPVLRYAPQAQSAKDFRRLAQWLGEQVVGERAVG